MNQNGVMSYGPLDLEPVLETAIRSGCPFPKPLVKSLLADEVLYREMEQLIEKKAAAMAEAAPVSGHPTHVERLVISVIGSVVILIMLGIADIQELQQQVNAGMNLAQLREREKQLGGNIQ